jgi:hypothetical protein
MTQFPDAQIQRRTGAEKINEDQWRQQAVDLWASHNASLTAREALEANMRQWNSVMEMEVPDVQDTPWEDASNVFIPVTPAKLEALRDQVIGLAFVPEFYIVTGFGDAAQQKARTAQEWANNEFRKERDDTTWFKEHVSWLHMGLWDGTAIMEVMWRKITRKSMYGVQVPAVDGQGQPIFDDKGEAQMVTHDIDDDEVEYNDPYLQAVKLKDFLLIPDESKTINSAVGVEICKWLYESDCMAMVEEGLLNPQWVERALAFVPTGTSDVTSDRQGSYEKTAGGQIDVGQGQGSLVGPFFRNRGPLKVWRIHSRQYDMNGDGIPEENVFWLHEQSQYMLGWCPQRYVAPRRPFFSFCPFPRPNSFYGFSLIERLAPLNGEINNRSNQRNNAIDRAISPPTFIDRTEEIWDKGFQWGINKSWAVRDPSKAVFIPPMPDVPLADWQQEASYDSWCDQISGLNAPMTGGQSSGRRSATEIKVGASSAGVRSSEIAMELRIASRSVLHYWVSLKRQYPWEPAPNDIQITREDLGLPFRWDVSGISDPLDQQTFADEVLGAFNLLQNDPDVKGDAVLRYNMKRMLLGAIGIPNVDTILGTPEDAAKRKAAEQQAQQQQMAMQQEEFKAKLYQMTKGNPGAAEAQGQGGQGGQGGPAVQEPPQPSPGGRPQ